MNGIVAAIVLLALMQAFMLAVYEGNEIWEDSDIISFLFRGSFVVKFFAVTYLMMSIPIPGVVCILLAFLASIVSFLIMVLIIDIAKSFMLHKPKKKMDDTTEYDYSRFNYSKHRYSKRSK